MVHLSQANHPDLAKYTALGKSSTSAAGFCTVRDILIPKLAVSAVSVHCIMLISDLLVQASFQQVCLRRTAILKALRALVADSISFVQQPTAVALSTLIVAEYRAGNTVAARCHGNALQAWFVTHGGFDVIEDFSMTMQVSLLMVLTVFNVTVLSVKSHFDKALERFEMPRGGKIDLLGRYAFAAGEGPQIALLYILSSVKEQPDGCFHRRIRRSLARNVNWAVGPLILVVAEVSKEILPPTWRLSAARAAEFVQMLSFATRSTRTAVVQYLVDTLHGRSTTPIDVDGLKGEIRRGWAKSVYSSDSNESKKSAAGLLLDISIDTKLRPGNAWPRCPMWLPPGSSCPVRVGAK
jgi:hypothetical protein